jgi:hypothetical protein
MTQRSEENIRALRESLGPTEKMLDLIINFPDHLWHNRPGVVRNGRWKAATKEDMIRHRAGEALSNRGEFRQSGPNVEAIIKVYSTIAGIWQANNELAARLASYIMRETDWRDMKVICSAFMLVQNKSGEPVLDDFDHSILFLDDDFREVGEAMLKTYQRGSNRMMNPKLILRIRDVLSLPEVAQINRVLVLC